MANAACPRCQRDVAMSAGLPVVSASGAIVIWHPSCWAVRVPQRTPPMALPVVVPRRRSIAAIATLAAFATIAFVVGEHVWLDRHAIASSFASFDLDTSEQARVLETTTASEERAEAPHETETIVAAAYPIPTSDGGRALDAVFTSLHDWTHPVTGATELMPTQASRLFGADRMALLPSGRPEGGLGLCGVDLDGPRGRSIVALPDGTVCLLARPV